MLAVFGRRFEKIDWGAMSAIRVGIMGFGRTGRTIFRILHGRTDMEVAAICDMAPANELLYLLKFDTLYGRFGEPVSATGSELRVRDHSIPFWSENRRDEVPPWSQAKVDVVVDCTARELSRADLQKHLDAGAPRVVLGAPSVGPVDLVLVRGLNDSDLRREHRVVGLFSPTVACVAPILSILDEAFGIERAFFDAVHAYTNAHRLADVPLADKRRGRSAAENIIPQESRSEAILSELLPALSGRLVGSAVDVPVANGSVVDLTCWHSKPVGVEALVDVVRRAAASERWKGIVACEEEEIVSSDVTRSAYSCVFDAPATMTLGAKMSKTLCWLDSGWAFAERIVEVAARLAALDFEAAA
jgi:glyceraldehyde 3-phosphate dehydrogenase